jgi:aryl-alcohol dehydrogenase-like predicted oxidoreductase
MGPLLKRPLGKSGITVAPFALGGNVFGWTVDEATGFRILDAFVSAGFNLIDTADVYSTWVPGHRGGESETIIGNWLRERGCRKDVLIATKVGNDMGPGGRGLSAGHIVHAADASLQRLQTDYIDLYQAHDDDPDVPLEETLEAFSSLVDKGKVRAVGASNYDAERLKAALRCSRERGFHRYESLQPLYNLMDRQEFEGELEEVCRREGLGVLTYYSLAAGFLSGKYRSKDDLGKSPRGRRAEARLNERGFRILAALDEVASRLGSFPATVALAWVMARQTVTAPIASATSLGQLDQLLRAADLHLDPESMRVLDEASAEPPR